VLPFLTVADQGSPNARILSGLVDSSFSSSGMARHARGHLQAANLFEPTKFAGVVFNERN